MLELKGDPKIIKRALCTDKKTGAALLYHLHKINDLYYWFDEDDVDFGTPGGISIEDAFKMAKEHSDKTGCDFIIKDVVNIGGLKCLFMNER